MRMGISGLLPPRRITRAKEICSRWRAGSCWSRCNEHDWQAFWNRAALIKITSKDGAGEYMENLRDIYLYVAAVEKGEEFPGTHAGVADMINAAGDTHKWDPSAFWHWNLRMQVAANIGAGLGDLNAPYFNLYRENLANIEEWTRKHMEGRTGCCVPETMRFNGRGIEYESTWETISMGLDCAADSKPYYNARTLTTGAEVSLWVWQQYLATNDRAFLERNYPLMASAARFLLAYQKPGADGLLHTGPSNAHETQWDVTDPTTDLAAIKALYPATIQAATLLGRDSRVGGATTGGAGEDSGAATNAGERKAHAASGFARWRRSGCDCGVVSAWGGNA